MSGVLGQIRWLYPRRSQLCGTDFVPTYPRLQQLVAAKEILAEVFKIDIPEVEKMIRSRMEDRTGTLEKGLWPQMFTLEEMEQAETEP